MSKPLSEYDGLFEVKYTFDPLKEILKKISDKQHAMEIEIKVMRDSLADKAEAKDLEEIKSLVTVSFNNSQKTSKQLEDKFKIIKRENAEIKSSISGVQDGIKNKVDRSSEMIKEIEGKLIRTDR